MDKVFHCLGASNHSDRERAQADLYTSDPKAVQALLEAFPLNQYVFEPCAGLGHISELIKKTGRDVITSDINDYGYKLDFQRDFFQVKRGDVTAPTPFDIVTNPPYKGALDFVKHAIELLEDGGRVIMLLRIQFLEGIERGQFFKEHPPRFVYVFTRRVLCLLNGEPQKHNSAACFAWFIWEKDFKGDPVVRWLLNDEE